MTGYPPRRSFHPARGTTLHAPPASSEFHGLYRQTRMNANETKHTKGARENKAPGRKKEFSWFSQGIRGGVRSHAQPLSSGKEEGDEDGGREGYPLLKQRPMLIMPPQWPPRTNEEVRRAEAVLAEETGGKGTQSWDQNKTDFDGGGDWQANEEERNSETKESRERETGRERAAARGVVPLHSGAGSPIVHLSVSVSRACQRESAREARSESEEGVGAARFGVQMPSRYQRKRGDYARKQRSHDRPVESTAAPHVVPR